MSSLIDGILDAETLSKSTKTQYLEKLNTLKNLTGKPLEWIVTHPNKTMAAISRRYPEPLTQRAFVAAIKAVFRHTPHLMAAEEAIYNKWTAFQSQMSQIVAQRYMAAQPSEKERRNWVPWADVLAKEQELAAREFGSTDHLLLAMYCLIEPLRQDYGALRILVNCDPPQGTDENFLIVARDASWGKLVLNTYKTAKRYGRYERQLPPGLLAVIKASLMARPRSYLFVDESGGPYKSTNSFTQFSNRTLRRVFGKNFTVSLMRHSHISSIDFNASTPGDLFEKSRNMAHSISMQQLYRRNVEPLPAITVVKAPDSPSPPHPPQPPPQGVTIDAHGNKYILLS